MKALLFSCLCTISIAAFSQEKQIPAITFSNSIQYTDTSFTDLPGNGFLIDIGDEVLAVTCKHSLWVNRSEEMKNISFESNLNEWKMVVINDPSQYIILGDLINEDADEVIGERNTDADYLVFKVRVNHSDTRPLKLSPVRAIPGDTLYQVGWTYKTKTSVPQSYAAVASKYMGPALLANAVLQQNFAGLSGSPVINRNNELVAIVSSWRHDEESGKWFNAPCSTDYLWQVLYNYWLGKNNRQKNYASFNEFLTSYKALNGYSPEISSFLYTEIFFDDWLKSKGYRYGSTEKYTEWTAEVRKTSGISIISDNYRTGLLIMDRWKEGYIEGTNDFAGLAKMLLEAGVYFPGLIEFCEFSQELSALELHDKAISLLLSADEKIQHMGQLYAYLGDAYLVKGENDLAKEAYLLCLQTYPEYRQAIDGLKRVSDKGLPSDN